MTYTEWSELDTPLAPAHCRLSVSRMFSMTFPWGLNYPVVSCLN